MPLCDVLDLSQSVATGVPTFGPTGNKGKKRITLVESERQMLILF